MKKATLAIVTDDADYILLGVKDAGSKLGANRRNGPGGDIELDETSEQCVDRETREESGLEILEKRKLGVVVAHVQGIPKLAVDIYHVSKFSGTPQDTVAMKNWKWYPPAFEKLPFDEMHGGDKHWFPELLKHMESRSEKEFTIHLFYERPGEGFINMDVL